jgi:hypothetical protein
MRRPVRPLVFNPTLQLTAVVDVSRRKIGRRQVEIADARVVRFLFSKLFGGGRPPRLDDALRRQLVYDGILVRPSEVPREVHLDPRLGIDTPGGPSGAHAPEAISPALSPGSFLHRGPRLPPGIRRQTPIAEAFLPREEVLWVRRAGSGIALPYTLEPGVAGALRNPLQTRRARSHLPPQAIAALQKVGAFEDAREARSRRAAWRSQVQVWRRELRARGCVALRGLFTSIFLAAVREYYRRLEAEGYVLGGDRGRSGAPVLYDEPLLCFLGGQLASVVRQVTEERAPWTFSFLRVYEPGDFIASHRDTPVCRWNIDLIVGGEPAPERRGAWPLWVEGRGGARPIRLGLGDGLLYRGADVRHWRRAQPASHTTVLAAFHYGLPTLRSAAPARTPRG